MIWPGGGQYTLPQGLILSTDLPRLDQYLPKPLSPQDDRLLQQQLRAQDDLLSQALLLFRYTGMRIGELLNLPTDALRHLGGEQRALHVSEFLSSRFARRAIFRRE